MASQCYSDFMVFRERKHGRKDQCQGCPLEMSPSVNVLGMRLASVRPSSGSLTICNSVLRIMATQNEKRDEVKSEKSEALNIWPS